MLLICGRVIGHGRTDRQTDYRNARHNILHPYREQRQIAKVVGSKIFHLANAKKAAITVLYVGPYSAIISHTRHIPVTKAHSVSSRFVHCSETYEKTVTDSPTKRRVNVPVRCLLLHL